MIDFLLKSAISLIVFLGFYYLILEREKIHKFNRFYLLISILISLIIPFVTFEFIEFVETAPVIQYDEPINIEKAKVVLNQNPTIEKVIIVQESINYLPYVFWSIYVLISFIFLFRFGKNYFKLIVKSKINPSVKYKNANLILLHEKILPHTFLNFIFVNSEDFKNKNIEDELFAHEMVHVNQKHTLDILFIEFLKALFWFHPLFYLYKKAIQLNHEFLADEEIVNTYNNVPYYQNLLLHKSNGNTTIYLASNLNYLITKKRLLMMTKNTSKKIALLKKVAAIPILAGLIYFFCIEIIAQEKPKVLNLDTEKTIPTDKDKIRDAYYSGVYVKICDEKTNRKSVTLYEKLSLEDKRKYLDYIPEIMIEKEIPAPLFEKMKTKDLAVWINGNVKTKEEIKKYKRTDFSYYSCSFIHKNARSKRFPQSYQYTLFTKEYFNENLKKSHTHFSGDTIKIVLASYKTAMKDETAKYIKADTLVWFTEGKEDYNLFINDIKNKKIDNVTGNFQAKKPGQKVIVIDAGHGGKDLGAKIDEELESKIVESIAKKIKALNGSEDLKIILLREDDNFVSLSDRVNKINQIKPDILISLHLNASKNPNEKGVNAFISSQNGFYDKSLEKANQLIENLSNNNLAKGGVKDANLYIIKNSKCPAVLLEVGYLSNENDKAYITSESGKDEIAKNILALFRE
ncbi:N-acetylmuramoyl-L-alanine amidase [Flavobacterium sp.]|uniref:N-acetylmuramoyl-L-alanine amidase n=1 Tax=Flavobacterium sp. TaxID=239 RepID=UPI0033410EBE